MTRTPQELAIAADEEMMAALERAGVDMNELGRLSTDDGLFVVERDDLGQELVFRQSDGFFEGTEIVEHPVRWWWHIYRGAGRVRLTDVASGWEPDVASMVARVVAFLGMGKP